MITMKDIGKMFREARENRHISIEDANRKTRIHPNVIRDLESGDLTRLSKTYVKSFLKKYAEFLELDAEEILKEYVRISSVMPEEPFTLKVENEQEKESTSDSMTEDKVQMALIAVFSVVLLILVLVLFGMVRSRFFSGRPDAPVRKVSASKRPVSKSRKKPVAKKAASATVKKAVVVPVEPKAPEKKRIQGLFFKKKEQGLALTLKARGKVWVQVNLGKDKLFVGTMKKGESKTWKTEAGVFIVWTGKAEMLEFTVNRHNVGEIAKGVVKNIKVSREGISLADDWITRFD